MDRVKAAWNLNQLIIVRAPGLLPMLYSPRELEQELGVPSRTLREWIKHGMPHQRDDKGFIWIPGIEFAQWVKQVRETAPRTRLKQDEAFCLHCKQAVKLCDPQVSRHGKQILLQGQCPTCGSTINRGGQFDPSQ